MPYRGVGAVVRVVGGTRYSIENDGIIDITTNVNGVPVVYKEARLVGLNHMGDCVRVNMPRDEKGKGGGPTEIPINLITKIADSPGKNKYPSVKKV
jgi:hypothetical protein